MSAEFPGVPDDPFNDVDLGQAEDENSAESEAISELSRRLETLGTNMNEERFIFAMISVIVFDAYDFHSMQTWGGPVAILILEIVALVVLARRLGVSDLSRLVDKILETIGQGTKG